MMIREGDSVARNPPPYPFAPPSLSPSSRHAEPCSTRRLVIIHRAVLHVEGSRFWGTWSGTHTEGPRPRCVRRNAEGEGFGAKAL